MVQKTGLVMAARWHCVTPMSRPATMIGELCGHSAAEPRGEVVCGMFVLFIPPVPHTDTCPRTKRGSVKLRSTMRFGLLLLSCRGEGL
ncbi:hypothetical protein GCM10009535_53590 [Streptomyces thermocarboxydovorans]|uniref:Secreted protein n=1 Tax=Streptomyces thermocarboxydovorans TaxID=59298 RepID=A0ABN1HUA1_9ACTN